MIDRSILREMGFRKSDDPAWGHEVWYHDTDAWVHYESGQQFEIYDSYGSNGVRFNGDTDNMKHFSRSLLKMCKLEKRIATWN